MTKLKCKPCSIFYRDNGTVNSCGVCGGELKRIRVHGINPKSIVQNFSVKLKPKKKEVK